MTRPLTDPEALIAALAEEARRAAPPGEPTPEELLDYLAGRLPPEDEERLGRQLAASPEAARALLDLADLEAAGAAAGEGPSELATRAGWRDLQTRLPAAAPWVRRLPPLLSSLAAALLIATLGIRAGVERGLRQPIANVKNGELASDSRAAAEETFALAPGSSLRLVLNARERCPRYQADIEGPSPGDHNTVSGLEWDQGNVTLLLRDAAPGKYRLRLSGCEPRKPQEFSWRIVRPDPQHPANAGADGG
ncbi:MAG TPA: hypothetical protein VGH73_14435 [Thermoanaerobaculia bacterium]